MDIQQRLYGTLPGELAQFGGVLRCTTCGIERGMGQASIGTYLAQGWPKHCGYTMRWVTQKELDQEVTDRQQRGVLGGSGDNR